MRRPWRSHTGAAQLLGRMVKMKRNLKVVLDRLLQRWGGKTIAMLSHHITLNARASSRQLTQRPWQMRQIVRCMLRFTDDWQPAVLRGGQSLPPPQSGAVGFPVLAAVQLRRGLPIQQVPVFGQNRIRFVGFLVTQCEGCSALQV